jgi:hypothetical protein
MRGRDLLCSPCSSSTVRCAAVIQVASSPATHMSSEWRAFHVTSYTVQKVVQFAHLRSGTTSNLAEADVIQRASQEHNLRPCFSCGGKKIVRQQYHDRKVLPYFLRFSHNMHAQARYRFCVLIIFSKRGIGGGLRPDSGSQLLLPRAIRNVSICKTASYTRSSMAVSPNDTAYQNQSMREAGVASGEADRRKQIRTCLSKT